jgi:hypothetical protein
MRSPSSLASGFFPKASIPRGYAEGEASIIITALELMGKTLARFAHQLTASAAMPSHVKRWPQLFSGHQPVVCPRGRGRDGASTRRRVRLRLSVGCLPPAGRPSGACRWLGSRVRYEPLNAAEGAPTPGRRLCCGTWATCGVAAPGVRGPARLRLRPAVVGPWPPGSPRVSGP